MLLLFFADLYLTHFDVLQLKNENSYSHHFDPQLGISVIDRFTYHLLEFMEEKGSKASIGDLPPFLTPNKLHSTVGVDASHFTRPLKEVPLTDFMGSVLSVIPHISNGEKKKEDKMPNLPSDDLAAKAFFAEGDNDFPIGGQRVF